MTKRVLTRFLRKIGLKQAPSALALQIRAEGLTYLSDRKLVRLDKAFAQLAAQDVPGAYIEFGVALGGSAVLIAEAAAKRGVEFCGFDVFGRIPPPTAVEDDAKAKARYEVIAAGQAEGIAGGTYYGDVEDLFGQVVATLTRYDHPPAPGKVVLHKGLFEETVPQADLGAIAFAHIDCDWYDPVRFCLSAVAPRLSPGGVIVLDDYHDYEGCKTAVERFLAENPDFELHQGRNPFVQHKTE